MKPGNRPLRHGANSCTKLVADEWRTKRHVPFCLIGGRVFSYVKPQENELQYHQGGINHGQRTTLFYF